jgi:hypothetical protein
MRAIYHYDDALRAEAKLEELARQLQKSHPGAAGRWRCAGAQRAWSRPESSSAR